jgi:hypothetical protein
MHGPGIFVRETVLRSGGNVKRGRSARRSSPQVTGHGMVSPSGWSHRTALKRM